VPGSQEDSIRAPPASVSRDEKAAGIGKAGKARHTASWPFPPWIMAMANSPSRPDFAVGQVWRCNGRTPDEMPMVLINRIDEHPMGTGRIYHVSLSGIRLKDPSGNPVIEGMPHIPVTAQTFERSDAEFVRMASPDPAYLQGYSQWKQEFDAGNAGSFGVSIAEVLDFIERAMASRN
jgi:hypothetical protein